MSMLYLRKKDSHKIFAIEEKYSSLVWTERYQEAGDFELEIPLKVANIMNYAVGNYISLDDSPDSMIIESREIDDSVKEPIFRVKGRSVSSLLDRRVNASRLFDLFAGAVKYEGPANTVLSEMFDKEINNPIMYKHQYYHHPEDKPKSDWELSDLSKLIPGLGKTTTTMIGSDPPEHYWEDYNVIRIVKDNEVGRSPLPLTLKCNVTTNISTYRSKIETVYSLLCAICKQNYLGFRSYFDLNNNIVVEVYRGTNRSSSGLLSPVIFSPIMDNVTRIDYFDDYSNYKTTGFVFSDAYINYTRRTDLDKFFEGYQIVGDTTKTGVDRYGVDVDVREEVSVTSLANADEVNFDSLKDDSGDSSDETETTEPTFSSPEAKWNAYFDAIAQKVYDTGVAKFDEQEYEIVETSEGEVDAIARYRYGEDYDLGDMVEINDLDGAIVMTAYISEAVRSYDQDGYIVTPNFKNMTEYDDGKEDEE